MVVEVNFGIAFLIYLLVILAEGAYLNQWGNRLLYRVGQRMCGSIFIAALAPALAWIYLVISFGLWFSGLDPTSLDILLPWIVGGAVVSSLEAILYRYQKEKNRIHPSVEGTIIERVEYAYRRESRAKTIEYLRELIRESGSSEEFRNALQLLLQRDDELGELTREVVATTT